MKKNFFKLVMGGLVVLASSLAVSCSPSGPDNGQTDGNGNTFITTQTITPLRYTEMKYNAGNAGVSIEVTKVLNDNFVFVCKPGSEVRSYRVNAYPLATINNFLLNLLNAEKATSYTVAKCEEYIANMINNTESQTSGGVLISATSVGDDFANMEFDWMNSTYAKIPVRPQSEYLVVCQAYFDEEGKDMPADLTICHLTTNHEALIGEPSVGLNVTAGYSNYTVKHEPNADAYGYFFLSSNAAEIDQFIDVYGEDMYSQLLRHYGNLVLSTADAESHYIHASDQPAKDMQGNMINYVSTALAVDKNCTPAATVNRFDFTLRKAPDNPQVAEGIVTPWKVSATVCQFHIELQNSARRLAYYVYKASDADQVMAKPEAERRAIALGMVTGMGTEQNPGWVVVNPEFAIDFDGNNGNGQLTGNGYKCDGWQHELLPSTPYKIVYAMMNGFGQATDLFVSDAFTSKPLVKDQPQTSIEDVEMKVVAANRTAFTIDATFTSENTARIYWQYYYPDNPGAGYDLPDPAEVIKADENRKNEFAAWDPAGMDARMGAGKYNSENNWLYWFLVWRDPNYGFPWPNEIIDAYQPGQVLDQSYFDGFESGKKYYFAYIAEDWNGVLGPVKFFDGTTKAVVPGNNPALTYETKKMDNGDIEVIFKCNDDTRQIKHAVTDDLSSDFLYYLLEENFGGKSYEFFMEKIDGFLSTLGLDANGDNARCVFEDKKVFDLAIAAAMPIGGVDAGKPVYGDIVTIVYNKKTGELKTLEEFMGVKK